MLMAEVTAIASAVWYSEDGCRKDVDCLHKLTRSDSVFCRIVAGRLTISLTELQSSARV